MVDLEALGGSPDRPFTRDSEEVTNVVPIDHMLLSPCAMSTSNVHGNRWRIAKRIIQVETIAEAMLRAPQPGAATADFFDGAEGEPEKSSRILGGRGELKWQTTNRSEVRPTGVRSRAAKAMR